MPNYHVADEADATYHEFGHTIQGRHEQQRHRQPGCDPRELSATNRDLDTVLEALADFYAADVARDAVVLPYLAANFFRRSYRRHRARATAQLRSAANTYVFPDSYVREAHLDGRVLSGALNDFR